jgi:hypothetical protein
MVMSEEINVDLNELERLAKAATPGPWVWNACGEAILSAHCMVVLTSRTNKKGEVSTEDATYISAANPAAVLTLLDRVRELDGIDIAFDHANDIIGKLQADVDRLEADHKATVRLTLDQVQLIHALLMPGIAHGADHTESAKDQMRSVIAAALKEAKGDE